MSEARKVFEMDVPESRQPGRVDPARTGAFRELARELGQGSILFGTVLVVAGLICWSYGLFTTFASVMVVGGALIAAGICQLIDAFRWGGWGPFFLHLASALLYGISGVLMWRSPLAGAFSLTMLMASVFMVGGIMRAVAATSLRLPGWGWSLTSGIVSALLGIYLFANLPVASLYLIGTFVSIELLLNGAALIALGLRARRWAGGEPTKAL